MLHRTIARVTEDLPLLKFNTAIAGMMEAVNAWSAQPSVARETYAAFLRLLSPFAPHLAEELWELNGGEGFAMHAAWPQADERYLGAAEVTYGVQINGKARATVTLPADLTDKGEIERRALEDAAVREKLGGQMPRRVIVVPGKVVSIVV